jgi:hypothetical protein
MKSLRIYLVVLSVLVILYLVAQFNRPKAIDWTETYSSTDKIPFGTYIIYNRLNDIFPGSRIESFREPVYDVINGHGITHGTYVIICNSFNINEYDYKKLVNFIKSGNDVFVAANDFSDEFSKRLKIELAPEFHAFTNPVSLKFVSKYLDSSKTYQLDKESSMVYFKKFNQDTAVVLGKNTEDHVNYLKYGLGKGNLYLSCAPMMFTNYALLNKSGQRYAETALSYIKSNHELMWDQYYALGRDDDDATMRVFLRNDALRWAFYIAFFSLLGFVVYDIKRRQRIIPVIEPLENATLSFVNTVGQVYFEEHNNRNLADKKITYFLEHLRERYNLKTTSLDKEFINGFSQKTGIDIDTASGLVNYINYLNNLQTVNNDELIQLNRLIEQFYIKSR